jgi:O-glycosyl hydrolase
VFVFAAQSLALMGFDHNKDHLLEWANTLYSDAECAQYIDGLAVHWSGLPHSLRLPASIPMAKQSPSYTVDRALQSGAVAETNVALAHANVISFVSSGLRHCPARCHIHARGAASD